MTENELAIRDVIQHLESTWNAGDSTAYAAAFVEDANFIHIYGGKLDGRRAVEAAHKQIFEGIYKGSEATFTFESVRFVRPDVGIVFNRAHIRFYDKNEVREIDTRPTFLMVKKQGKWEIVFFQNTKISEMPF